MLVFIGYISIYCKDRAKHKKTRDFFKKAPRFSWVSPAYQEKMT